MARAGPVYVDPELLERVATAIQNTGRGHQVDEIAQDLGTSETEVEEALKQLEKAGRVTAAEEWGNGHVQYTLVKKAKK